MTELDQVIMTAFKSEGKQEDVNQVYLAFLCASLVIPVKKGATADDFYPLFAHIDNRLYMLAFDQLERLTAWAGEQWEQMEHVILSGRDLIKGIENNVFLCLNVGTDYYKEFSPDEIKHLKKIVALVG